MIDSYDIYVPNFDETFHFYINDTPEVIDGVIEKFLSKFQTNNEITINYAKYSQHEENEKLAKKVKSVITDLKNSLTIFNPRMIVNLGAKVQHTVVSETDVKGNFYLVQFYSIRRPL